MAPFRSRRTRSYGPSPLVAFLLVASFGILFVGCGGTAPSEEEVSFTEDDVADFTRLTETETAPSSGSGTGTGSDTPYLLPLPSGSGATQEEIILDLSKVPQFNAIRAKAVSERNQYRVTNEFVNVRAAASSQSAFVERLDRGTMVSVLSFPDASWAEVQLANGKKGFIASQYIARVTSDDRLADEKKRFEGQYYVNFAFVNVRQAPDQSSPKIGEIPGQRLVHPTSIQGGWAAVPFEGKTGYVSESYLAPFLPSFQVRQETFELPILHYRIDTNAAALLPAMTAHVKALKERGYTLMTLRQFSELLEQQEQRDVRLNPKTAVVAVSGITSANVQAVSDALAAAGIKASIFIETSQLGIGGITEKQLLTMKANGLDIGSAGHTGDDFRALTNAQATLELQQSRKLLEERAQMPIVAVAFPQGGVNDRIAQLASEAGYLFGIGESSSRTFTRKDLLRLPSIVVFPTMTTDEVMKLATGQ